MGGLLGMQLNPWDTTCSQLQYFKTAKNTEGGVVSEWDTS